MVNFAPFSHWAKCTITVIRKALTRFQESALANSQDKGARMTDRINYQFNARRKGYEQGGNLSLLNKQVSDEVLAFHQKFPAYQVTPLRRLNHLSQRRGWGRYILRMKPGDSASMPLKVLVARMRWGNISPACLVATLIP